MPERSLWPNLNIPEEPSRISLAVDKFILGTFAVGLAADLINNLKPHSLDFISARIENHIGNFPPSVVTGHILMNTSRALLFKAFKDETAQKLEPILPIASILMVVGLNMATESLTNPNPELVGDVVSGAIGGALGVTHMLLPDRFEFNIARKLKSRHK